MNFLAHAWHPAVARVQLAAHRDHDVLGVDEHAAHRRETQVACSGILRATITNSLGDDELGNIPEGVDVLLRQIAGP